MRTTLDLRGVVKSPHDVMEIRWEVDGSSGCTTCEAWRGQHEIDQLMKAGYTIMSVRRVNVQQVDEERIARYMKFLEAQEYDDE